MRCVGRVVDTHIWRLERGKRSGVGGKRVRKGDGLREARAELERAALRQGGPLAARRDAREDSCMRGVIQCCPIGLSLYCGAWRRRICVRQRGHAVQPLHAHVFFLFKKMRSSGISTSQWTARIILLSRRHFACAVCSHGARFDAVDTTDDGPTRLAPAFLPLRPSAFLASVTPRPLVCQILPQEQCGAVRSSWSPSPLSENSGHLQFLK